MTPPGGRRWMGRCQRGRLLAVLGKVNGYPAAVGAMDVSSAGDRAVAAVSWRRSPGLLGLAWLWRNSSAPPGALPAPASATSNAAKCLSSSFPENWGLAENAHGAQGTAAGWPWPRCRPPCARSPHGELPPRLPRAHSPGSAPDPGPQVLPLWPVGDVGCGRSGLLAESPPSGALQPCGTEQAPDGGREPWWRTGGDTERARAEGPWAAGGGGQPWSGPRLAKPNAPNCPGQLLQGPGALAAGGLAWGFRTRGHGPLPGGWAGRGLGGGLCCPS